MWSCGTRSGQEAAVLDVCLMSYPGHEPPYEQEKCHGKVRQGCGQERGAGSAPGEGRKTSIGQRRQGDQPCAGDCHRTFRGAPERRQGPKEEILARSDWGHSNLIDTPRQLIARVTHRKQTIGTHIKCHTFRGSRIPGFCPALLFSNFKFPISNSESRRRAAASDSFSGGMI